MDKFYQELMYVLTIGRNLGNNKKESKAASLSSFFATETNKAPLINNLIFS